MEALIRSLKTYYEVKIDYYWKKKSSEMEGSWTDYTEKGFGADWRKCREVRKIEWVHFSTVSASSSHLHFIITLATVERWGWAARLTIQCI